MRNLMVVGLLVLIGIIGIAPSRAAGNFPTMLPDCQGVPQSMPSKVVFACGDGNVYASNLTWTNWGQFYAYARGTLTQNDCTPNCAAGHFHTYEASLTVWGQEHCPNGDLAYRRVAYTITDPAFPSSGQAQYIGTFPCKPM
jgi:hypothetical protein